MRVYRWFVTFSSIIGLIGGLITIYMFISGENSINGLIKDTNFENYNFLKYFYSLSFPEFIYSFFRLYCSYSILAISVVLSIITIVIDVILLIFGMSFPLTKWLWIWAWNDVVISWYWNYSSIENRTFGIIIMVLFFMFMYLNIVIKKNKEHKIE